MHNNYYFLRQLAARLESALNGFTLVSSFSQEKDELVIEFNNGARSFFIKASFRPELQCLSFPATYHRARKNSVDLFPEVLMRKVEGIRTFSNERSLGLQLSDGWLLIFKMHGKQGNVLLAQGDQVHGVFRHNFPADRTLRPSSLDREIQWNMNDLPDNPEAWKQRFVTFGKPVWDYLDEKGFDGSPASAKEQLVIQVRALLENPSYYVVESGDTLRLSLLPVSNGARSFHDPLEAANAFFQRYHFRHSFAREKETLMSSLRGRIRQSQTFIANTQRRLSELLADNHYTRWADLIMANLHRLNTGMTEASLEDFQEPGTLVVVKLRKELTPQKNAEVYYRKAKNQSVERDNLSQSLKQKQAELAGLLQREAAVASCADRESLTPLVEAIGSPAKEKAKREALPYRSYEVSGFTILVGKNAAANDELTLRHTYKEDLWLHARDVAGSHVVIKHQAGKTFPKNVIDSAASLAAWHSRRKNESLCPVSVTPVKYVRKRKGDPPGTVVLQQEKVVLVPPRSPEEFATKS
ncbi:MAG: DUF814 domain-containing protein [Cyclobacteriaceae bacterium]|nr:DUF814 domain-containing protein [Cyclobacteriaceae bacterium]